MMSVRPLLAPLLAAAALLPTPASAARSGAEIYTEMCARCHGTNGQGVADKYDEPLYGDRSLKSLTRLIQRTMPEDSDEKCSPEEAEAVASFIFDSFYSPKARANSSPAKIDAARLTARQYENAVADLLGSFTGQAKLGDKSGLTAEYFDARGFNSDKRQFERVDPRIQFDFGQTSPDTNKLGVDEFAIRWRGSLIAEETGEYEFDLSTGNGARLYLNDSRNALIDAWVSSGGEMRENRATIRLLGGRAYPIEVNFFKFKDKSAGIVLKWKPPHKAWEPVPERALRTSRVPETFVIETAFPPDDSSSGYARGITVSKAWDLATTHAGIEVASAITDNLERFSGAKPGAGDRDAKVKEFAKKFVERAFRRPLTDEEVELFISRQFSEAKDLESALKQVVILALKSPRFLYPELRDGSPDQYDTASRLSFALWDSIPDRDLLSAAARGELETEEHITRHAERMLKHPQAKAKMADFFVHWLELEVGEDLSKDPEAYPDFSDVILADLRTSLEMFIDNVVWNESSDYRELILADYLYLNPRLAKFYGADAASVGADESGKTHESQPGGEPTGEETSKPDVVVSVDAGADQKFEKYTFDPKLRAGVLTHPYMLTALAYYRSSSPIHRGVFLSRHIVGRALKPPPAAIQFMDGRFDPGMTMREKVTELTSPAACQGCHVIINPLGFSLENFDGVGRFRTMDNGSAVNAASDYITDEGDVIRFTNPRDVAEHAVGSEQAHRAFVRQMFQHIVKQPAPAYGAETLEELRGKFAESNFNIQKLIVEIVKVAALHRASPAAENVQASASTGK